VTGAEIDFYATPAPMTDVATIDEVFFEGLPDTATGLCSIARQLMVHEFLVGHYDVEVALWNAGEIEQRSAAQLVATILDRHRAPLCVARPATQRAIGNCRQYSVLTVALLRRAGFAARARGGFADYFDPTMWVDHWIVELWDRSASRWVRVDAQIDDVQLELLGLDFDPLDVPAGRFLTGSEAWTVCRNGRDDPTRFGIDNMRGEWFIAGAAIRDLAALNKVEPHTWDLWGTIADVAFRPLTDAERTRIDDLAAVVASGDLDAIGRLYRQAGYGVADPIISARTQQPVIYPVT
jgi:Transglutaminase-like superfamily